MKKRFKIKKLNNDGAALIFAILVVMFISILTTILLYVSGMNYEMKMTDYKTQISFYGAETPLEELRVQLAEDASGAAINAYKAVMKDYSSLGDGNARTALYKQIFVDSLETTWYTRKSADTCDPPHDNAWCNAIHVALSSNANYKVMKKSTFDSTTLANDTWYIVLPDAPAAPTGITDSDPQMYYDVNNGRIHLQKVTVVYKKNDFISEITTDLVVIIPDVDWSVNAYDGTWDEADASTDRAIIDFEHNVFYMNWEKK